MDCLSVACVCVGVHKVWLVWLGTTPVVCQNKYISCAEGVLKSCRVEVVDPLRTLLSSVGKRIVH